MFDFNEVGETIIKEEVYKNEIMPLMTQIIEVCRKNKIAMLASFRLENEDSDLMCTTAILTKETNPPAFLLKALKIIYRKEIDNV